MLENLTYKEYKAHREHKEKIRRRANWIANVLENIKGVIYFALFVIGLGAAVIVYGVLGASVLGSSGLLG